MKIPPTEDMPIRIVCVRDLTHCYHLLMVYCNSLLYYCDIFQCQKQYDYYLR